MKRINLLLPQATLQKLTARASSIGIPKSKLLKEWIAEFNSPFLMLAPTETSDQVSSYSLRLDDSELEKIQELEERYKANISLIIRSIIDNNIDIPQQVQYFSDYQSSILELLNITEADLLLQKVTDQLQNKLKIQGSVLFLVDGQKIYSKVHSSSWFVNAMTKVLGKRIEDHYVLVNKHKDNLLVKSFLNKKAHFTTNYREINVGALNEHIANITKTLIKFKSGLIYPISQKGHVIGLFLLYKGKVEAFDNELPFISAISDFLGARLQTLKEAS